MTLIDLQNRSSSKQQKILSFKTGSISSSRRWWYGIILDWLYRIDGIDTFVFTDGSRILHTLLVKHYNDLLDKRSSERGNDEVI